VWKIIVSPLIYVVLASLACADLGLFICATRSRRSVETSPVFFRNPEYSVANVPPAGYTISGVVVDSSTASARGWIVRYASQNCTVCRADEPRWRSLKLHLLRKGYRIYIILPQARDAYSKDAPELSDSTQIAYPRIGWIKLYYLTATPTTLLFDSDGKMIWNHFGQMTEDDERAALEAAAWKF
jgi:hypothetical protein